MEDVLKALYDRVTSRALYLVLLLALVGAGLHGVGRVVGAAFGVDPSDAVDSLGPAIGIDGAWLRLLVYGGLQLLVLWLGHRWIQRAEFWVRRTGSRLQQGTRRWLTRRLGRARSKRVGRVAGTASTLGVTAVLVAFVLQPTLVPWRLDGQAWLHRAANLLDGRASVALLDSVLGLGHRVAAPPVLAIGPVSLEDVHATLDDPSVPLMDRWDASLLAAADQDADLAARTKAVMWVESGGRQYAVSSTGCAGLMQFCASTAQRAPFHGIFGVGQVNACSCRQCAIPREVQHALETDPGALERHRQEVPCPLSDARFDGEKSIRAGVAYVRQLSADVGGHLLLAYVGYNAGPRVAERLYEALGEPDEVTIDDLRPHLADALRPYHGRRADSRARGLLDVHLPKLLRAYDKWRP